MKDVFSIYLVFFWLEKNNRRWIVTWKKSKKLSPCNLQNWPYVVILELLLLAFIFFGFSIVSSFSGYYYYLFCKIDIISLHCKWFLTFFCFFHILFLFLIDSPFIWILIASCFEIIGDNYRWYTAKELLCKDDATLFDFFGLAPTTHHSPRLDALYFPTMPNASESVV